MTPVEQYPELTRAMRAIDEGVAELGFTPEYEAQLLDILQRGWLRGPQTIPFDSNRESLLMKCCHLQLDSFRYLIDKLRRAPKAAALAHKAVHSMRKLIEALPRDDAEGLRNTAEPILREVLCEQTALEGRRPLRKRGGQMDSSVYLELALLMVFDYYFAATGDWPTKYQGGPFVAFAAAILGFPAETILRHLKRLNLNRPVIRQAADQRLDVGHLILQSLSHLIRQRLTAAAPACTI